MSVWHSLITTSVKEHSLEVKAAHLKLSCVWQANLEQVAVFSIQSSDMYGMIEGMSNTENHPTLADSTCMKPARGRAMLSVQRTYPAMF